jgi:hypothetical protein
MALASASRPVFSLDETEPTMDTPVCRTCAKPQRGVVEFRWSDGDVVFECRDCGAFNVVSEIARPVSARPSHRHHLRVTREFEAPVFGAIVRVNSKEERAR